MLGWLAFFCTDDAEEAERLCEIYPWLEEIYFEMASYSRNPEEVLGMFSAALREMDRNTVRYMVEEQKKEIEENKKELAAQREWIEQQNQQIEQQNQQMEQQNQQLEQQTQQLEQKDQEIERLKRLLAEKG